MSNNHLRRLHDLFNAAVDMPVDQREAWIVQQCADDQELLGELRNMLVQAEISQDPLEDGVGRVLKQDRIAETLNRAGDGGIRLDQFGSDEQPVSDLSSDKFCEQLSKIEILSGDALVKWLESVQPPETRKDPTALARQLVSEGKITEFQASVLLGGRSQQLLIDKYLILDLIDSGGMGMVFKAVHRTMKRVVALKMLPPARFSSPAAVQRFRREVEVAATLEHPNIVTAFDADESKGVHFLVMEYARGRDLFKRVQQDGPMTVAQAVDCVLQAAAGLQHAHTKGIIHRDIKPGNLILTDDQKVKILDLGLAGIGKAIEPDNVGGSGSIEPSQLTQSDSLLGTVAYMAPEQAADSAAADARSDVYALGCTLYFLLTGETPFGSDPVHAIRGHETGDIPSLREKRPDVSVAIEAIFKKMLAKAPSDRQQSIQELITSLKECQVSKPSRLGRGSTQNKAIVERDTVDLEKSSSGKQINHSNPRRSFLTRLFEFPQRKPWDLVGYFVALCVVAGGIAFSITQWTQRSSSDTTESQNHDEAEIAVRRIVRQSLIEQLGEDASLDDGVVQLLTSLRLQGRVSLADELERRIRLERRLFHLEEGRDAFVAVGRILIPEGHSPSDVHFQTVIQEDGYFVTDVKNGDTPMIFRALKLEELQIPTGDIEPGAVVYVGEHAMQAVAEEDLATFEVTLDAPLPSDLSVYLGITKARCGVSAGHERDSARHPKLESSDNRVFRATELAPTSYKFSVTRKGSSPLYSEAIRLTAGESRRIGPITIDLDKKFAMKFAYARDGDFSDATVIERTVSPKELIRFAPVEFHDVIYPNKDYHDCRLWPAPPPRQLENIVIDSAYQPCYLTDLGKGDLTDFLSSDLETKTPHHTVLKEYIQYGHVYLVRHDAWGHWAMITVTEFINASDPAPK